MKKENATVAADAYTTDFLSAIKKAQTDGELITLIDKIYEDGFEDGYDEGQNDDSSENKIKMPSDTATIKKVI